jgi:hypothetical protein
MMARRKASKWRIESADTTGSGANLAKAALPRVYQLSSRWPLKWDHISVRGSDHRSRHLERIEPEIGYRLGNALAIQLGDYGFSHFHQSGRLGGAVGHSEDLSLYRDHRTSGCDSLPAERSGLTWAPATLI